MPIFSSDSEDDVAPVGKLFGRERPVHALLGGGKGWHFSPILH